jgi:hypothetical protein
MATAMLLMICLTTLPQHVGAVEDTVPPHADAGEDQTVGQGETVHLSGSNSTDNQEVRYWRWTIHYLGRNYSVPSPNTEFTFEEIGTFIATLNVTDAAGNWDIDSVTITVQDATPPVAVITMQTEFDQFNPVELDGSLSQDNVAVTNWTWTIVHELGSAELYGETVHHGFPYAGFYTINLTVRDAMGIEGNTTITAMARDFEKPVVVVPQTLHTTAGNETVLDGSACHDNVKVVSWKWTVQYDKVPHDLEGERVTFNFEKAGQWQVTLHIQDEAGNGASTSFTVIAEAVEEEDEGGIPALDGAIIVLMMVVIALLTHRKRRFGVGQRII